MKILFVRTYCPNAIAYGSEMRASRFVDYFRGKGELDLLTLATPTVKSTDTSYIKAKFRKHYCFDQKGEHQRLTSIEKFINLLPWQILGHYAKDFQNTLNQIIEENQYDLIFVFKLEPVLYFLQLSPPWQKKVVIDFDDILSDLYLHYYKKGFTAYKNSHSLRLYEHKAISQFKQVFVCSQGAVSKIPSRYRAKVSIVPNVFMADREKFLMPASNSRHLLYVGSLDYFVNIEGLKWFFQCIWPDFKKSCPDVTLTIAGKSPNGRDHILSLLGNPEDVKVAVNVPDLMPYYRDCFASIVPLLDGSGTRLKILESAAYGRPVISTLKGMEGLDFKDKEDIFIFNNVSSFIASYKSLLDEQCYLRTVEAAWQTLLKHYSPEAFLACMDAHWRKIIG